MALPSRYAGPSDELVSYVLEKLSELRPLSECLQMAQDAGIASVGVGLWQRWVSRDRGLALRELQARARAQTLVTDRLLEELGKENPNRTKVMGWVSMAARLGVSMQAVEQLQQSGRLREVLPEEERARKVRVLLSSARARSLEIAEQDGVEVIRGE
jgi:hypothetical protein